MMPQHEENYQLVNFALRVSKYLKKSRLIRLLDEGQNSLSRVVYLTYLDCSMFTDKIVKVSRISDTYNYWHPDSRCGLPKDFLEGPIYFWK